MRPTCPGRQQHLEDLNATLAKWTSPYTIIQTPHMLNAAFSTSLVLPSRSVM
jgi:hypothetical protein